MYVLFTDTDTDITPEVAAKYGYNLISMPYSIGDKEIRPYVDFDKFDSTEFYRSMRNGVLPKTGGLSPKTYYDYFAPFFKEGKDVLYVHFSAAMSGTFEALAIAVKQLKDEFPERTLYAVDTKGITIGSYNIVLEIGDLYLAGKTVEEIQKWAETEVDKFATYFFVEDLTFFKRSGRVSGMSAVMGNLFGIRPIITMNSEGKMVSFDKKKGNKNAVARLVELAEQLQDDIKGHRVILAHSDAAESAALLEKSLKEKFGEDLNVVHVDINPPAGSHCGPGGVGINFHAIHR